MIINITQESCIHLSQIIWDKLGILPKHFKILILSFCQNSKPLEYKISITLVIN